MRRVRPPHTPAPLETIRNSFLSQINGARSRARLAPLELSDALCRAAQTRAETIVSTGDIDKAVVPGEQLLEATEAAGYAADELSQVVAGGEADPAEVVRQWRERGSDAWKDVLGAAHRDLGVGAVGAEDGGLYVLIFARSAEDAFVTRTAGLHDLARVRAELLASVNRERARAKRPPLRGSTVLDRIAQSYADDMLARGFYGHLSPEHGDVSARARAGGYSASRLGENLAKGQTSVDEVMDGWMHSPEHRENIVNPWYTEAGFGLAMGKTREGSRAIWVQVFGRPRGR
jgi:uncharacterized protein YkwD